MKNNLLFLFSAAAVHSVADPSVCLPYFLLQLCMSRTSKKVAAYRYYWAELLEDDSDAAQFSVLCAQ